IQALDVKYTGGPGPSQSIGEPLKKQSKRDWVHEDHGCGLDCREASAPATKGVPGYAFKLLTTRHNALATARGNGLSGSSNGNSQGNSGFAMHTVTSEPFGVFYNLQECDIARAQKIAELDAKGDRQPHYPPTAPKTITTMPNGTVIETISGPLVSVNVSFCEPGIYEPKPSREMAKNLETTGAAAMPQDPIELVVPPGFVKHYVAPRPFSSVIPGTPDRIEILRSTERELVFMVKAEADRPTSILLVNDDGEVVANLKIITPAELNGDVRQGPNGYEMYRKGNPDYVAPKEPKK